MSAKEHDRRMNALANMWNAEEKLRARGSSEMHIDFVWCRFRRIWRRKAVQS